MTDASPTTALPVVERLRATLLDYEGEPCALVNPDGPAAADTIAALYEALEAAADLIFEGGLNEVSTEVWLRARAAITLARTGSVS